MILTDNKSYLHKWLNHRVPLPYSDANQYIGWSEDGIRLRAVVAFTDYYGKTIQIHVATKGKNWMRRKFLWATMHYPFVQLKLNWLIGVIQGSNEAALLMNKNLGFTEFSRLSNGYAEDEDLVLMSLHRSNPRVQKWLSLGERYGQGIAARPA